MSWKVHKEVFSRLNGEITSAQLTDMKVYLETAELIPRRELEQASSFSLLWTAMERKALVGKMKYGALIEMLRSLNLEYLVNDISDRIKRHVDSENIETGRPSSAPETAFQDQTDLKYSTNDRLEIICQETTGSDCVEPGIQNDFRTILDPVCSVCFYTDQKQSKAERKCYDCDEVVVCLECCKNHEVQFQHRTYPIGDCPNLLDRASYCQKHVDHPRRLNHGCADCCKICCDLCLTIDHRDCSNTYNLYVLGKDALISSLKLALKCDCYLPAQSEISQQLATLSRKSFHLIQDILLISDQHMKSIARQRDTLIRQVQVATDRSEVGTGGSMGRLRLGSENTAHQLSARVAQFPKLCNSGKPCEGALGQLRQVEFDDDPCSNGCLQELSDVLPQRHEKLFSIPLAVSKLPAPTLRPTKDVKSPCVEALDDSEFSVKIDNFIEKDRQLENTKLLPLYNTDRVDKYSLQMCTEKVFNCRCWHIRSIAMASNTTFYVLLKDQLESTEYALKLFPVSGEASVINHSAGLTRCPVVDDTGKLTLLTTEPPAIFVYQHSASSSPNIIPLENKGLDTPIHLDINMEGHYFITHGEPNCRESIRLTVLDGTNLTTTASMNIGDHKWVTCAGDSIHVYTNSDTEIASYTWDKARKRMATSGVAKIPDDLIITGTCSNESGDLFVVGWVQINISTWHVQLYMLIDGSLEKITILGQESQTEMKSFLSPRIACRDGHILVAYSETKGTIKSRLLQLCPS